MNLMTPALESSIETSIIKNLISENYFSAIENIQNTLNQLYAAIPDNKRISYGRVYTIKILSRFLYSRLMESGAPVFSVSAALFKLSNEFGSTGVALGMISFCGIENYKTALPYFEAAAISENWDVREFAQMFFRKLIKKYPDEMRAYLLERTTSNNANIRRFVAETLRPVQENQWLYKNPEFSLSILRKMFQEPSAYPRTAVGNNLSDLARRLPGRIFEIVQELVESGNKNSYWIAYRACRNLVKTEPIKVMDILKVDEYKYKKRVHRKSDYL